MTGKREAEPIATSGAARAAVGSLLFAAIVATAGCGEDRRYDEPWSGSGATSAHALVQFDSCEEFETYLKGAALDSITARIKSHVSGSEWGETDDWGSDSDSDADTDGDMDSDSDGDSDWGGDADTDADSGGGDTGDVGETGGTNTQEQGVDEADLVKTDGHYFYALSGGDLVIVRIEDDGQLAVESRYQIGGAPRELMVYEKVAVVFTVPGPLTVDPELAYPAAPLDGANQWADQPRPGHARISVIDVSDRSEPVLVRQITLAGNYVSSRRVGSSLRAVFVSPLTALQLPTYPPQADVEGTDVEQAQALIAANAERLAALSLDEIVPRRHDLVVGGTGNDTHPYVSYCRDTMGPRTTAGASLTSVLSIELDDPGRRHAPVGIVGDPGQVYASESSLYLATGREYVIGAAGAGEWDSQSTGIHKFDIASDPGEVIYEATGTVPGHMLNQFSMGEHRDYLRVATSTGTSFADFDNHLLVLEHHERTLRIVGERHGIGTGEELYAARFHGERGYMVTWRQQDPLFVFNLAVPSDPQLVGTWEGPGFSTYLHPVGDEQLLSVGLEGAQVAVSLYDVSYFSVPTLIDRVFFPGGHTSPALNDHRGFNFSDSRDLLALPFEQLQGAETGLYLYAVADQGITAAGTLSLGGTESSSSPAQRSVFLDDEVYAVSRCRITSAAIAAPGAQIDSVALYSGGSCPFDPVL